MNLLLDTHTFIWWACEPGKLPKKIRELCENYENSLILSVVSVWEMQIKMQLGKMKIHDTLSDLIESQMETNGVTLLDINLDHVMGLDQLPLIHHDPFDRLLISQAVTEDFFLVSKDKKIEGYPVKILW